MSFEILPGSISGAPPEYELGFRVIWKGQLVIYTDAEAAIFPQYSTLCELPEEES